MTRRFLIACDSFKGTMSSREVADILSKTILEKAPDAQVDSLVIADGGENTVEAFLNKGKPVKATVTGPYIFQKTVATYADLQDSAVIETASAAGLPMVDPSPDSVLDTTTFGLGELLLKAGRKASKILIGLGGSCTTDGGCGALCAAGARFYDEAGSSFIPTGRTLKNIHHIDVGAIEPSIRKAELVCICDVTNPFFGENGAARVFGPQKGADPATVEKLDEGLRHLANIISKQLGIDLQKLPGAGAAGGLGGGLASVLGARLESGIDTILSLCGFDAKAMDADWIITGEGRLDSQSFQGKAISGVLSHSPKKAKVVIFAGKAEPASVQQALSSGFYAVYRTSLKERPFEEIRKTAKADLREACLRFIKDIGL
ncbi:MAG: glycerate kinase [Sphaerochaetaceae bacterium]|jgi:glycerate kinase